MSFSFLDSKHGTNDAAANSISAAATNAGTGQHIIVLITWADTTSTVKSVTDTAGNSYTQVSGALIQNATMVQSTDIWFATNISANASNAVKATYQTGQTPTFNRITIHRYSTTNSGSIVVDHAATGNGTSTGATNFTCTSYNTSQASEVDVGWYVTTNAVSPFTAGTNYTLRQTGTSNDTQSEDWIMSATQTGVNLPMSGSNPGNWIGTHAAFKEPAAAGNVVAEDDSWTLGRTQPIPVPQQFFRDDDIPASSLTATVDEYFWQNPVPNPVSPNLVPSLSVDEQTPFLFGQADEDFWPVLRPQQFTAYQQPQFFDPSELPVAAVAFQPDEVYWLNLSMPLPPIYVQPTLYELDAYTIPLTVKIPYDSPPRLGYTYDTQMSPTPILGGF